MRNIKSLSALSLWISFSFLSLHALSQRGSDAPQGDYFPAGTVWINTDFPMSVNNFEHKITLIVISDFDCLECGYYLSALEDELRMTPAVQIIEVVPGHPEMPVSRSFIQQYVQQQHFSHPIAVVPDLSGFLTAEIHHAPHFLLYEKSTTPLLSTSQHTGFEEVLRKLREMKANPELLSSCYNHQLQPAILPAWWADPVIENPSYIAADPTDNTLYVNDLAHNRIVELGWNGTCTAVIGNRTPGFADDQFQSARFDHARGMAHYNGRLYIADTYNHRIRVADISNQRVSTLCGNGGMKDAPDGSGPQALGLPTDVEWWNRKLYAVSGATNEVYEVDAGNGRMTRFVQLVVPEQGMVRAYAKNLAHDKDHLYVVMSDGGYIRIDKKGNQTAVSFPAVFFGALTEWDGSLAAADPLRHEIYFLDKTGWNRISGTGQAGDLSGDAADATFNRPFDLTTLNGELIISDQHNHLVRRLNSPRKGRIRNYPLELSREIMGEMAAHTEGEMVVMDTVFISKKESTVNVMIDKGVYSLVNAGVNEAEIDDMTGVKLVANAITEDGFSFKINSSYAGYDVYLEVYLTLEDPAHPGVYLVKRSYLAFVIERTDNAPAIQEQVYTVNLLPN